MREKWCIAHRLHHNILNPLNLISQIIPAKPLRRSKAANCRIFTVIAGGYAFAFIGLWSDVADAYISAISHSLSMDTSVATVDDQGRVTGVARGLAIIQATFQGDIHLIYVRVS